MSEIKKYYDTDLIGSGGGYTMTEIEKLAYNKMPDYLKIKSDHEPVLWSMGFEAGAAAVIELIKERMPGEREITYFIGTEMPMSLTDAAWNGALQEVYKALNQLTENKEDEPTTNDSRDADRHRLG